MCAMPNLWEPAFVMQKTSKPVRKIRQNPLERIAYIFLPQNYSFPRSVHRKLQGVVLTPQLGIQLHSRENVLLMPNLKTNFNSCRPSLVQDLLQGYDFHRHQTIYARTQACT